MRVRSLLRIPVVWAALIVCLGALVGLVLEGTGGLGGGSLGPAAQADSGILLADPAVGGQRQGPHWQQQALRDSRENRSRDMRMIEEDAVRLAPA